VICRHVNGLLSSLWGDVGGDRLSRTPAGLVRNSQRSERARISGSLEGSELPRTSGGPAERDLSVGMAYLGGLHRRRFDGDAAPSSRGQFVGKAGRSPVPTHTARPRVGRAVRLRVPLPLRFSRVFRDTLRTRLVAFAPKRASPLPGANWSETTAHQRGGPVNRRAAALSAALVGGTSRCSHRLGAALPPGVVQATSGCDAGLIVIRAVIRAPRGLGVPLPTPCLRDDFTNLLRGEP
jgi:hypothetical protein